MAEKPAEISDLSINDGNDALDKDKLDENSMSLERKDSLKQKTLKKRGHLRVKEDGQTTYKRTSSSAIMSAIQLGIGYSVGRLTAKQERDILMQDFSFVEKVWFPSAGSRETPTHRFNDFKFKSYAPSAFRYFRDLFGMQPSDFLMALSNEELRELSNPGASGSLFFLSADDNFIIKTVQHKEATFLQQLLPGYYMNLHQNPRTLLPKFFGLYCYQSQNVNIRLVVMNNILPTTFRCHQIYDLKGSTFKRKASKSELAKKTPTKKDLDFRNDYSEGITMEAETYDLVMKTIKRDCRVLESFKIMDYSLLLGIHNMDQALRENKSENDTQGDENPERIARRAEFGAALEAIQIDKVEGRPLGGIPAKSPKGDRLILFLGIIDILQSYRIAKKLEHGWKSFIYDGDSVSVHNPSFYARRFINFMGEKVLKRGPPGPRGSTKRRSVNRQGPGTASFGPGSIRNRAGTNEHFNERLSVEASTPRDSKTKASLVKFSEPTELSDQMVPPSYEASVHQTIETEDTTSPPEETAENPVVAANVGKEVVTSVSDESRVTSEDVEIAPITNESIPGKTTPASSSSPTESPNHVESPINHATTSPETETGITNAEDSTMLTGNAVTIVTKTSTKTYENVVRVSEIVSSSSTNEVAEVEPVGRVELEENHVGDARKEVVIKAPPDIVETRESPEVEELNNSKEDVPNNAVKSESMVYESEVEKTEFKVTKSSTEFKSEHLEGKGERSSIEDTSEPNSNEPDVFQVTNLDTVISCSEDLPDVKVGSAISNDIHNATDSNDIEVTLL